jgi:hypothetical protein
LLRGQLDGNFDLVSNTALSPLNEVPPVTGRPETGLCELRLIGRTLYSRVTYQNLIAGDVIQNGHIHEGGSTVNGPVLISLCDLPSDFGTIRVQEIDNVSYNKLRNDPLYINVHSDLIPAGILRGQIRG